MYFDKQELIGKKVQLISTHAIGTIVSISGGFMWVSFWGEQPVKYKFPEAFGTVLIFEDPYLQKQLEKEGAEQAFEVLKGRFIKSVNYEIDYLKATGGKKYKAIDGILVSTHDHEYVYAFDVDTDLHFPDGTVISIIRETGYLHASVVACEEFTLMIRSTENLGGEVPVIEFTANQWELLALLNGRIEELSLSMAPLAYEVASKGPSKVKEYAGISTGQKVAINKAENNPVTFIWGPPGTGKTETLSNIALDLIGNGKRVLMLSYSNVSVDGALLRVAKKSDYPAGTVVRYGFPRLEEILESNTIYSYRLALSRHPDLEEAYEELKKFKKKLRKKDPNLEKVNKQLSKIRESIKDEETVIIENAAFVATTISKAASDKAVYTQTFDTVIFDEASMAYVPQIIFAASLARKHFICMGDFKQLPAIVQNVQNDSLKEDIFDYTGITNAVDNGFGHEWLVMLDTQYRMHPDIADFVSERMYSGLLHTADRMFDSREEIARMEPVAGAAMSLLDLSYTYSACIQTLDGSRINIMSALISMKLAEQISPSYDVGIISPYSAQSRLILAMIRDIQEDSGKLKNVTSATVHQFQGSEKPVIIYDATDCYRMKFPGMLLTQIKNDTANRLFNVALTRAQGKFIVISNVNFMFRKKLSKKLLFSKALDQLTQKELSMEGSELMEYLSSNEHQGYVFSGDTESTWDRYVDDLKKAKKSIKIDIPGFMDDDDEMIHELSRVLDELTERDILVSVRYPEEISIPEELADYAEVGGYITNPVTVIDRYVVWYGQPLSMAEFISEGELIPTEYFPCLRFQGRNTARSIEAFLEM